MTSRQPFFSKMIVMVAICLIPVSLHAKDPLPDAPVPAAGGATLAFVTPTSERSQHKFWDTENKILFATSFAAIGADFAVTRANLQSGGQELNPLVRVFGKSTAALAANFAAEGVGTVGLSYFFHKTGHHKMERAVTFVNIGGSFGAVGYGLAHR